VLGEFCPRQSPQRRPTKFTEEQARRTVFPTRLARGWRVDNPEGGLIADERGQVFLDDGAARREAERLPCSGGAAVYGASLWATNGSRKYDDSHALG
jgi:hypothetical protein